MRHRFTIITLAVCTLAAQLAHAQTPGRKRAVLVGINDYSASRIIGPHRPAVPGRDWPALAGAAEDATAFGDMLALLYGFDRRDIVPLLDQRATRGAILDAIHRQLVAPAQKGDTLFFYFAGHGSQVANSLSDEPDKLDETLVPADSMIGARDIRDKELRALFNEILDRGAKLTIVIDSCHSASGARGLPTGLRPRGVAADPRDVKDAKLYGPRPEDRGALVLAASHDDEPAWPARDEQGNVHGVFSWAFLRALRDSAPGESAEVTFSRAAARMRGETPYQDPVLAGTAESRMNPFLGVRTDRRDERTIVAVEKVRGDGTVLLQGGWANGLAIGSELRVLSDLKITARLTITAVKGLGESEARITPNSYPMPQAIRAGALMEVAGWAAPAGRPLRVWMPRVSGNASEISALANRLYAEATRRGVQWISDPLDANPSHVLRRGNDAWELLANNTIRNLGTSDADAIAAVLALPRNASLFVQLPAPAAMIDGIGVGPNTDREGVDPVARAEDADYILAGRVNSARRLSYAWLRPLVRGDERRKSGLPARTDWVIEDGRDQTLRDSVAALRDSVLRLRKIHGWTLLESPPESRSPYHLAVHRAKDGQPASDSVSANDVYELRLSAQRSSLPPRLSQRYFYIFVIDSHGTSTLLFPRQGSVENRFPLQQPPPRQIALAPAGKFEIAAPFGVDTYYLLSTDEALPNPWILEWDGVRTRDASATTPLEKLLLATGASSRAPSLVTPSNWSIERAVFESLAPRAKRR